jgi:hypothetical protein
LKHVVDSFFSTLIFGAQTSDPFRVPKSFTFVPLLCHNQQLSKDIEENRMDLDDIDFNVNYQQQQEEEDSTDSGEEEEESEEELDFDGIVSKTTVTLGGDDEFDDVWKEVQRLENSDLNETESQQRQPHKLKETVVSPPVTARRIVVVSPRGPHQSNASVISNLRARYQQQQQQQQQYSNQEYNDQQDDDDDEDSEELQRVQDQWDNLAQLRAEQKVSQTGIRDRNIRESIITYKDALRYFKGDEIQYPKDNIRAELGRPKFGIGTKIALLFQNMCFACGTPMLKNETLQDELEFIFCIARTPLDHTNDQLERMITTVYRKLTGDSYACPSVGSHWDLIGFQGGDPKTDLRAAGMFGVLQLICFLQLVSQIPNEIYQLSRKEDQQFPFAVTSLSITGIVLQCLREGKLVSRANQTGSLLDVANDIYMALFYKFFVWWKRDRRDIMKFDETKKQLQELVKKKKNIKGLIDGFYYSVEAKNAALNVKKMADGPPPTQYNAFE